MEYVGSLRTPESLLSIFPRQMLRPVLHTPRLPIGILSVWVYVSPPKQECGQYWKDSDNKFECLWNQCKCLPCLTAKVQFLKEVRDNCYKDFGVLVHFQCPRVRK
ncbi:hypothetical protein LSH36_243g03006 [Paralvinella palmiformis]|uniref:Uncharacterized protein n=1 Tax=Paralvinella palmiformis TaxID=53620 RepID=A0AAD9JMQ7_9ANNE|nr:hypothetical protein LSH36_243g03006 [Paralvinella palmiformis]